MSPPATASRGSAAAALVAAGILLSRVIGLVREPLPYNCPQCSAVVSARFNYCPACKFNLRPACSNCRREVRLTDRFCPHCAQELESAVNS